MKCIILMHVIVCNCYGQKDNLLFHHLTTKQGLPHNKVSNIFQDRDGFIWISTTDGLSRYDGKYFNNYFHSDSDRYSIQSDNIGGIVEDSKGNLIIAHSEGISRYDKNQNKFISAFVPSNSKESIKSQGVKEIVFDKRQHLWVAYNESLLELDSSFRVIRHFENELLGDNIIWQLLNDSCGNILINKGGSINILNPATGVIYNSKFNPEKMEMFSLYANGIAYDPEGNMWVLSRDHLLSKFNQAGLKVYKTSLDCPRNMTNIYITEQNKIWLTGLGHGLFIFDIRSQSMSHFLHVENDIRTICDNTIWKIMKDKDGNNWICTINGLDLLPKRKYDLKVWNNFDHQNQLSTSPVEIAAFYKHKSTLWVAGWGKGIYRINLHDNNPKLFVCGKTDLDNYVWDLAEFNNRIWYGNFRGLHTLDPKNGLTFHLSNFSTYPKIKDSIAAFGLFKDQKNNLWASFLGSNGITRFDSIQNRFDWFTSHSDKPSTLPFGHYDAIAQDSKGRIWMGNKRKKGIAIWNDNNRSFSTTYPDGSLLFNDYVNCILADGDYLWVGSNSGLYRIDPQLHTQRKFSRQDGLINNNVHSLARDNQSNLWIGTDNGLSQLDLSTNTFISNSIDNELTEHEIEHLFFDRESHTIYFSTPHAVHAFSLAISANGTDVLKPYITGFNVMGHPFVTQTGETVILDHEDKYFSFEFTAPHFPSSTNNQYAYKLDGFDTGWIYIGNRQFAGYTNLGFGNYTFRLKATTDGTHWFEMSNPVMIHITAPFYIRTWFILLVVLLLLTITGMAFYIKYRIKLQRMLYGQKIRNKISQDIHDDISSGLTKITWMSEMLKTKLPGYNTENKEPLLDKIISSTRETMKHFGEVVWSINPMHDNFDSLVSYMRNHIQTFFEDTNFIVSIDFPDELPKQDVNPEIIRNIYLTMKESLNNAAKYSGAKHISVIFRCTKDHYQLIIMDDGKGFEKSTLDGNGNGLHNMQKRMETFNGHLSIETGINKGTTINAEGPVN